MYKKAIPFHGFDGAPHTETVQFNLTSREVFKLLDKFQAIFSWQDSMEGPNRKLETAEVIEFYNNFEDILLSAYGIMSDDGLYFDKSGRFQFEDSALFAACMSYFVSDPQETSKLIDELMPKDLQDVVRKSEENLKALKNDPQTSEGLQAQIDRLMAEKDALETTQN